mmetsp:Transcript_46770/g.99963  ORF Transcript_46770/g.99963 Transcript_46770/m.99963 type:complete len:204 (-) Transcript_46770:356-967(-)
MLKNPVHGQNGEVAAVCELVVRVIQLRQRTLLLAQVVSNALDVRSGEGSAVQVERLLASDQGHDPTQVHVVEDLQPYQRIRSPEALTKEGLVTSPYKHGQGDVRGHALSHQGPILEGSLQRNLETQTPHEKAREGLVKGEIGPPEILGQQSPYADLEAVRFDEGISPSVVLPVLSHFSPQRVTGGDQGKRQRARLAGRGLRCQ